MKIVIVLFYLILCALTSQAQKKKTLTHEDYDHWKNLSDMAISNNGNHVVYSINPMQQDGNLFIKNLHNNQELKVPRGANPLFSSGNNFVVFRIQPHRDLIRKAKLEKTRKDDMPIDSLGIFLIDSAQVIKYENIISYHLPKEPSDWMAFAIDFPRAIEIRNEENLMDTIPPAIPEPESIEQEEKEVETEKVKQLVIKNPVAGKKHVFDHVKDYQISENGESVIFLQHDTTNDPDTLKPKKLFVFNTQSESLQLLDSAAGEFRHLTVNKQGELFAWLYTTDTTNVKVYDLKIHKTGRRPQIHTVSVNSENMPTDFAVSEHQSPSFSDDANKVFFGIAAMPTEEKSDTLLEEEKYKLDIWHWQDNLLQSQQKVNADRERNRSFDAVYHLKSEDMYALADKDMPYIAKDRYGNSSKLMGTSNVPYLRQVSWMGSIARDVYVVDVTNGLRQQVIKGAQSSIHFSVEGNYILYYDPDIQNWLSYSIDDQKIYNLTDELDVAFYDEENDLPGFARPYGIAGWGHRDAFILIYDKYDIWKIDPSGRNQPQIITNGYGRENQIRFRYQNLDPDEYHIPTDKIYLSGFNLRNKQDGYYSLDMKSMQLTELMLENASFSHLQKAKNDDTFIWRRSTFTEYSDLWTSDTNFEEIRRLTETNPQQTEYLWGSVSLVEWQNFNNDTLQGLLYLPEDFDSEKKYPMLVYFYERSSDGLHRHFIPAPSRSTINRSYSTSNGYIIFVPDIIYREGFPGQSAYDAVISGTKAMTERYHFIDRTRMGLQGQSWGGYQIAYLITQTNMFRAAMAGAPVSNMVSAYGGIRWSSGMSRQFQYEQTQSRIGGTLWDRPFHYIENSPVFYANRIETPLLMMHNDDDGAVPWYQGIELFVAMRRLDKPVWMLVYNNEAHNLNRWPNRVDLSIRMYQFFDHYLKDKPAPKWLHQGRSYLDKEKTDAYELVE